MFGYTLHYSSQQDEDVRSTHQKGSGETMSRDFPSNPSLWRKVHLLSRRNILGACGSLTRKGRNHLEQCLENLENVASGSFLIR
jgi:hypothetical protein